MVLHIIFRGLPAVSNIVVSIPFFAAMTACTLAGMHACATNCRWEAWAKSPVSRQFLGLLTSAVEAGRATESWLPSRGSAAAAAAATAAPRLDSVEVAIRAAVVLCTWVSTLPSDEEWPELRHWLLGGSGMRSLINATAVLQSGLFKRSREWVTVCPVVIAVSMYTGQRVFATDALWRDPCLGESMKRHLSLILRECVQGREAYTDSFLSMAIATEVMPNLAEQLHPDLLRLWPHLFAWLQLTDRWKLVEAVVPSFLRLIEALPSAVKCAHWLQHCSIAVDIIRLVFDALGRSELPEGAGCRTSPTVVHLGIVRLAVRMISVSSELPSCLLTHASMSPFPGLCLPFYLFGVCLLPAISPLVLHASFCFACY